MSNDIEKMVLSDTNVTPVPLGVISSHDISNLTISEISAGIRPLAAKYGIKSVMLIGSYARQTAGNDSDIDLIIELENELDSKSYFGFLDDAEKLFNKKIDLFTTEGVKRSVLKTELLNGGVYLYGKT